ncbi:hig [Cordylochernes scorpioides]|uniref:Hig n=1 Tax=Cordylochernes scorpioides TaxID=51811 RepID=A0ABY6LGK3_9ARAC|nr:hig [Cordylochernes scorpioides]
MVDDNHVPGDIDYSTVQEVQFLGVIGPLEEKRLCKIKCMNGVWVGPLCTVDEGGRFQPMLRSCPLHPPEGPIHVAYQDKALEVEETLELPHGSSIVLTCAEIGLFRFYGNSTLTCNNGHWSAPMPQCLVTTLHSNFSDQVPPTISYNVASGDAGPSLDGQLIVLPGSIVHFDCLFQRQYGNPQWTWTPTHRQYPSGWSIEVEERSWKYRLSIFYAKEHDSGIFTCTTPAGQTNEVSLLVQGVECPALPSADNNRVMAVEGNQMHSKARFACMEGYVLVGPEVITCTASGVWSDDPPHCQTGIKMVRAVIECPTITPEDGHLRLSWYSKTYGSSVYFSCPTGYRLLGAPSATCLKNQSWTNPPPTCQAIQCSPPLPPTNGRALDNGRYLVGDYVQYTCNAGFVIVGDSIGICKDDGEWTQGPPICKPACEFPGEPGNGHVIPTKFHYDIGQVVTVACNPGYRMLGPQRLRCTPSGHWSSPLPHCRVTQHGLDKPY